MSRFYFSKILTLLITLLAANFIIFWITYSIPGESAKIILGPFATDDAVRVLEEDLGLINSFWTIYLTWLKGILSGNWGISYLYEEPILPLILNGFLNSLFMIIMIFLIYIPLAIMTALISSFFPHQPIDRLLMTISLSLSSLPEFVTGTFLILIFVIKLNLLPSQVHLLSAGNIWLTLKSMILPSLTMVFILHAYLYKILRAYLLDAQKTPYMKTALYTRLTKKQIILGYLLPRILKPTLTIIVNQIGWLLGGLIVIETLFQYPGLGSLVQTAAINKDIPLLAGSCFMITAIFCFVYHITEILITKHDPEDRIALEEEKAK